MVFVYVFLFFFFFKTRSHIGFATERSFLDNIFNKLLASSHTSYKKISSLQKQSRKPVCLRGSFSFIEESSPVIIRHTRNEMRNAANCLSIPPALPLHSPDTVSFNIKKKIPHQHN